MATAQQQEQYDVLWLTTEGNPLLPASSVPTLNKSLATNAKQIIKAINEVLKNNQGTQISLDSFIKNFNTYATLIGDTYADASLSPKLTNIADNIILALDSLNTSIQGLDKTIKDKADTSITDDITKSIKNINDSLSTLSDSIKNGTSGGIAVAKTIINLGSCNVPYSTTSVYQRYALVSIPSDVIPKIDFNKPINVQIFHTCYGGFETLFFDSSKMDFSKLEVGYSADKKSVGIFNNTGSSLSVSRLNLILE
jgi:hypothetical protein